MIRRIRAASAGGSRCPTDAVRSTVPPKAFFESRVFESEDAAATAFTAIEIMTRRADGRACLASRYLSSPIDVLPIDADLHLTTEDVPIPGTNFGVRVVWTGTVESRSVDLYLDVVAALLAAGIGA